MKTKINSPIAKQFGVDAGASVVGIADAGRMDSNPLMYSRVVSP